MDSIGGWQVGVGSRKCHQINFACFYLHYSLCFFFLIDLKLSTKRRCVLGSSVGTLYGKGNYFARDASYSQNYTDSRTMFVVRVLVGDVAAGNTNLVKPPPRNATDPYGETYDSCVNDVNHPAIYVTFQSGQSYPAYVVQY